MVASPLVPSASVPLGPRSIGPKSGSMDSQHANRLRDLAETQMVASIERLRVFKMGFESLLVAHENGVSSQSTVTALNNWVQGFVVAEQAKQQSDCTDFVAAVGISPQDLY